MAEGNQILFGAFPEALLIASLTAAAYWLAFVYEVSYLSEFGLSPDLAEVSLQTTLLAAFGLSGAYTLFVFVNVASIFWPQQPATQQKIIPLTIILIILAWCLVNYGFRR